MKTLHRAAYEMLTPEEYKRFCRIPKERLDLLHVDWDGEEKYVAGGAFWWSNEETDICYRGYWSQIDARINPQCSH